MNEEQQILEQRMYCLTLYNISPIQQGIQSAHAIVEYAQVFGDAPEYKKWAGQDKTIIILNGGSSVTLNEHLSFLLNDLSIDKIAFFKEPDLFNGITAICFLADERIWDSYHFDEVAFIESIGGERNHRLKLFLESFRKA